MKNPFENKHNGVLIGSIAAGALIAGGLTWLFTTEKGKQMCDNLQILVKEKGTDLLAGFLSDKTGVSKDIAKPATEAVVD